MSCPNCTTTAYRSMPMDDTTLPARSESWKYHAKKALATMKIAVPIVKYLAHFIIGGTSVAALCAGLWACTVGAHRMGVYVGHDKLGWDMPTNWGYSPAPIITWALGIFIITGPFWLARFGRFFISFLPGRGR